MQCVKLSKHLDQTCNVFNPTKLTPSQKAETSVTDDPSTDKPSEGGPTSPINSQDYQEMKRLNRLKNKIAALVALLETRHQEQKKAGGKVFYLFG